MENTRTQSPHEFEIFIASIFMYLIGMVPGFLISAVLFESSHQGIILVSGMASGIIISYGFMRLGFKVDMAIYGPVIDESEKQS